MRPERPQAQREIDWQRLLDQALSVEGSTGNVYNRFHSYSFTNVMLMMMQNVEPPVATFKRWQSLGRHVLKGSKAAEIVRPIFIKKEDANGDEQVITRFKPVRCIFGYNQTEGEELPPPPPIPEWSLDRALETLGIRQVPWTYYESNAQGVSMGREFAINPMAKYPLKTTIHEIGHITLGHTTGTGLAEYQLHRGIKEWQAESTAYLSMTELELLTPEQAEVSRGYVQGWMHDQRPPDPAIREVFKATDQILRAGRLLVEAESDGEAA